MITADGMTILTPLEDEYLSEMVPDEQPQASANIAGGLIPTFFGLIVALGVLIYFTMVRDDEKKTRESTERSEFNGSARSDFQRQSV